MGRPLLRYPEENSFLCPVSWAPVGILRLRLIFALGRKDQSSLRMTVIQEWNLPSEAEEGSGEGFCLGDGGAAYVNHAACAADEGHVRAGKDRDPLCLQ